MSMVKVYDHDRVVKYTELFVFYRDGMPLHIHSDRKVFENWMVSSRWLYPPERCEIERFIPASVSVGGIDAT